jgi:tryptophanase
MLVLAVLEVLVIRMTVRLHTSAQSFLRVVVAAVGQVLVKRRSVAAMAVLVAVRLLVCTVA